MPKLNKGNLKSNKEEMNALTIADTKSGPVTEHNIGDRHEDLPLERATADSMKESKIEVVPIGKLIVENVIKKSRTKKRNRVPVSPQIPKKIAKNRGPVRTIRTRSMKD